MAEPEIKFSVITATYNAAAVLPRLISALQAQTDQDFEWVVADGASTDETLALLGKAEKTLNVRVDSRPDFGIYDALNRAVKMASGDYYLVVGADDLLFQDTIHLYKMSCLDFEADLITAKIKINGVERGARHRRCEWLDGQFSYVSGHAVGLVIRKELHQQYGFYSHKFPIAADQLFILRVVHGGGKIRKCPFVAGEFSNQGLSGTDVLGTVTEFARVQVLVGHSILIQMALCIFRILKNKIGRVVRRRNVIDAQ